MGYRAHITKCIKENTFFRHHVEGALDELRDKYRKALLYDACARKLKEHMRGECSKEEFIKFCESHYREAGN